MLAKTHANGDLDDEVVQLEYREIKETIALEKEFEGNGWMVFVKTKGNRRRLLILLTMGLFSQWSGNGLASYYLNIVLNGVGITNDNTKLLINGGIQIMNMIVALGQCFVVDRIGRRTLFLVSTSGMLVSFTIWTACAGSYAETGVTATGHTVIAMIFIYYIMYNMAWSGLLVGYGTEILPYNLRAKGLTLMFLMVNIALFFNQFVNPIALGAIGWKYYIVYCVWLLVSLPNMRTAMTETDFVDRSNSSLYISSTLRLVTLRSRRLRSTLMVKMRSSVALSPPRRAGPSLRRWAGWTRPSTRRDSMWSTASCSFVSRYTKYEKRQCCLRSFLIFLCSFLVVPQNPGIWTTSLPFLFS